MQLEQFTLDAPLANSSRRRAQKRCSRHSVTAISQFSITTDIESLENEWRAFEPHADCTPYQTFDWLSS